MMIGHTKFIRCVVYDNKTKTLYSAGDDAKIKMWEARSK
jgi:WD40 repeat protein